MTLLAERVQAPAFRPGSSHQEAGMSDDLDYYNDFDSAACAWMGELMSGGHIPAGRIDSRSILDVRPTDLAGVRRAHFFAGVAGWAEALRLAGWEGPVWTGSPPCQPFSAAGQRRGRDDDRHLGPAFVELVRACRPPVLFGEQVSSADVVGRASGGAKRGAGGEPAWAWCDDLFVRLEAAGYACGAAVVPACSVGAPHIRARLFFGAVRLADAERADGRREHGNGLGGAPRAREGEAGERQRLRADPADGGAACGLAGPWKSYADWFSVCWHPACRDSERRSCDCHTRGAPDGWRWDADDGWVADSAGLGRLGRGAGEARDEPGAQQRFDGLCDAGRLADRGSFGWDRRQGTAPGCEHVGPDAGRIEGHDGPLGGLQAGAGSHRPGPTDGFWRDADWLGCRDGKWRPAKSSVQRVDDGLPGGVVPGGDFVSAAYPLAQGQGRRVMRLRGYGNAIVPQVAAEFIVSFREALTASGIGGAAA